MPTHDPWTPLFNSKLSVLGVNGCIISQEQRVEFIKVLGTCSQTVKTCFLKTIINSWSTSHRLSEAVLLPCIMGCQECKDDLQHYLCCDPLWTMATCACGLPSSFLSLPPLERLCILSKSSYGLRLLSVVFRGYHAVRLGYRSLVDYSPATGRFESIYDLIIPMLKDMWMQR